MNKDVVKMLKIYKTSKKDWLGYRVCKNCKLTRHHIFKRVYGGDSDISNYALLISKSHEYLHILEHKDHDTYLELNRLFKELNDSLAPPTPEYYKKVNKVLKKARVKKP
jgi:hypothetical protein